mgnify:FL=1
MDKLTQLNAIYLQKKTSSFGNVPTPFHEIVTALKNDLTHMQQGFSTKINQLTNKRNWNERFITRRKGGGFYKPAPRLSVYCQFERSEFKLMVLPWKGDKEINLVCSNRLFPDLEFIEWNPEAHGCVIRIPSLTKFIQLYFQYGDETDLELIKYCHNYVNSLQDTLCELFNIQTMGGGTIQGYFAYCEKRYHQGKELILPPTIEQLQLSSCSPSS